MQLRFQIFKNIFPHIWWYFFLTLKCWMSTFLTHSELNHKAYWRLKTEKLRGSEILLVRLEDMTTQTKSRPEKWQHTLKTEESAGRFSLIIPTLKMKVTFAGAENTDRACKLLMPLCRLAPLLCLDTLTVNSSTYSSVSNLFHPHCFTFRLLCCTCFLSAQLPLRLSPWTLSQPSPTYTCGESKYGGRLC